MAELGLQSYNEQRSANQEQMQKLMTAEARNVQQSETISNLNEKLAMTETKLKSSEREAKELMDSLSKLDQQVAQLKADKKEKTTALFDLKDELAKALEQKRVIDLDRQNITARAGKLESQLGESETIVTQRGETISDVQVVLDLSFLLACVVHNACCNRVCVRVLCLQNGTQLERC
jgi:chromosome segregation ATPase